MGFEFALARPRGRLVYPRAFGSLAHALGVFWFIRGRWVHSLALKGSLGSSRVVGFTRARHGAHCVQQGSLSRILGSFGSSVSLGSLVRALEVVGFNRGRSLARLLEVVWSFMGRWVRSLAPWPLFDPASLGSLMRALEVVALMQNRWVRLLAHLGWLG